MAHEEGQPAVGGVTSCSFCWRPVRFGGHNEGCPVLIGTPEAMEEWRRGRSFGFEDNIINPAQLSRHYPITWVLGYRAGKAEIERQVECAFEHSYDLEY